MITNQITGFLQQDLSIAYNIKHAGLTNGEVLHYFGQSDFLKLNNCNRVSGGYTIRFSFDSAFVDHFIWLRGVISLGNHYHIVSDNQQRVFTVIVESDQVSALFGYLDQLLAELRRDIKFRAGLKLLLKLNRRHEKLYKAILQDCSGCC